MKIYSKLVLSFDGEVLEEESHEYNGPVARLGGSGGGSSGKVDFPEYLKDTHNAWLSTSEADTVSYSMVEVMNLVWRDNPYDDAAAYAPDGALLAMNNEAVAYEYYVNLLSNATTLDTLISGILDDDRIDVDVAAFGDLLDEQLETVVLPRFRAGMRDINATVSSAFVIGEANIEAARQREIAKYESGLRMKFFSDDAIRVIGMKLEAARNLATLYAEINRIKIVAKKEEEVQNTEYEANAGRWMLEPYTFGGNLLAAIGGGTSLPPSMKGPSTTQSAIGGAVSTAAAGALIGTGTGGPGMGTAIGGVIGGAVGLGAGLLM